MTTPAFKDKALMLTINIKEKEVPPLKTVKKFEGAYQNDLTKKADDDKMNKHYLNEKLYYFYTNGGPIMEL